MESSPLFFPCLHRSLHHLHDSVSVTTRCLTLLLSYPSLANHIDPIQSRLCGRTSPSNACTLIALQLVELFERRSLHFLTPSLSRSPLSTSLPLRSQRAHAGAESIRVPLVSILILSLQYISPLLDRFPH